jgi:hypothetical protein
MVDGLRPAEIDLPFDWCRPTRWTVEWRWTAQFAEVLDPANPWAGHCLFTLYDRGCREERLSLIEAAIPGKQYRFRPVRWVNAVGLTVSEPT